MFKQFLSIIVFVLIVSPVAYAQRFSEGEALSLQEALNVAYRQNPYLMEARKEREAQEGRSFQKKALPDPEAEFSIGGLRSKDDGSKGKLDSYTVMQPIGSLGERLASFSIADSEGRIARNQLEMAWAQIRARIIKLYAQVIAREKALEFSRDNLNSTRQLFVAVENRFHSGNALQSELTRARIEVLQAENDVLTHEKELKETRGELNLNLGRQPESALTLSDFLNEETLNYQYLGLVDKALKARPDLKAEEARLSIQKKNLAVVSSKTILPEMAVGFERTMEDYENDSAVVLKFSYPLWGLWGEVREAKAEYGKQQVRFNTAQQQAHLDIYQSFLNAELAERQVTIQKNALDEANELLRQVSIQYEAGEMPFITYLENLRTIKETRLNYLNALANYKEKIAVLDMAVGYVPVPEGAKL